MKVAIGAGGGTYAIQDFEELTTYAQEAEKLGVESIWSAEAWIHDAITPLAYLAGKTERMRLGTGIMQIGTRTPALAAMTAMTMTALTGGGGASSSASAPRGHRSSRAGTGSRSPARSRARASTSR